MVMAGAIGIIKPIDAAYVITTLNHGKGAKHTVPKNVDNGLQIIDMFLKNSMNKLKKSCTGDIIGNS